jgi:putative transposase
MYNTAHRHSSLGLLTPHDMHHGAADEQVAARAAVLATAYATHPERFPSGLPQPPSRPTEVWINPPGTERSKSCLVGGGDPSYAETSRHRAGGGT